ncbi:MAG: SURF1 family protein [Gemmatimonadota bacterium]|nr:SURF1 family protein [Gemmatimonadota bacterium]
MRYAALILGLGAAALFTRLGVWQLDRLDQRRALNTALETRLAAPPIALTTGVVATVDSLTFRRVRASGVFAFADEVVEGGRTFRGAPGAYLLTPLRFADGSAVLVLRGWSYAPDGMTVERGAVVEAESVTVEGVLLPVAGRWSVRPDTLPRGYPLLPLVLRRTTPPPALPERLAIVALPPRDNGPHLAYAIQWFAFAVIALVGGVILARRQPVRAGSG